LYTEFDELLREAIEGGLKDALPFAKPVLRAGCSRKAEVDLVVGIVGGRAASLSSSSSSIATVDPYCMPNPGVIGYGMLVGAKGMSGALAKLPSGVRVLEPFESLRPLLLFSREYCSCAGKPRCVSNASKDDKIEDMTCGSAGLALMRLGDFLRLDDELWLMGTDCDESHRCGCERSDAVVGGMAVVAATCMTLRPVLCSFCSHARRFLHLSIDQTA